MTIAYDLRFASDHFSGIGTHARALLEALLDHPGGDRYVVLWNPRLRASRFDVSCLARHPRVRWFERAWQPLHPLDPVRVSIWLRRVAADVFLSPFYLHPPAAGCPVVLTLHDVNPLTLHEELSPARSVLFRTVLLAARRAQLVLTSSEFSRREIVRLGGFPARRVRAVPLGVPPRPGLVPIRPRRAPDTPFAIVVGENRPRKNLRLLARVWNRLPAGSPALVSAGRNDPRYPALSSFARDRTSAADCLRSLGWVTEQVMACLYAHSSMVLHPSRYEGFGFPLVEAFEAGVPVIASDIPVFREVGGPAAAYVDPDDPDAWAAAVARLRDEPQLRGALIAAGRQRATALSYRMTARATLAALRDASMSAGGVTARATTHPGLVKSTSRAPVDPRA
jgi:glycosyltransferase involved in cell wall biosynthesis